jgi:hypothetical protein
MKASCSKYTRASACGHTGTTEFVFCGGKHRDDAKHNEKCYRKNNKKGNAFAAVIMMGDAYCTRSCRASSMGWRCCTCGYRHVYGRLHPTTNLLVHTNADGMLHGFCDGCADAPVVASVAKKTTTYIQPNAHASAHDTANEFTDAWMQLIARPEMHATEDSNVNPVAPLFNHEDTNAPPIPHRSAKRSVRRSAKPTTERSTKRTTFSTR